MRLALIARNVSRGANASATPQASSQDPSAFPSGLLKDLFQRGFVKKVTNELSLHNHLSEKPRAIYAGIDPSAKALHIGHLLPLMCLAHFHLAGHRIIPIVGGATGSIGDPSGKAEARQIKDLNAAESNVSQLMNNVQKFFQRALSYSRGRISGRHVEFNSEIKVLNNLDWFKNFSLLDFLRVVGANSKVNVMLTRDSARTRLTEQRGLPFSEFTYQLLQAYDFYHLYKNEGCTIQLGGGDQWGNIISGIDLISRLVEPSSTPDQPAYGFTTPLLETSFGEKLGKSSGNAVWLDSDQTSPFDLYQHFIRLHDTDVFAYLPLFTFLSLEDIARTIQIHNKNPGRRFAQTVLADEVTMMIHQDDALKHAKAMTKVLFEDNYESLKALYVEEALKGDARFITIDREALLSVPVVKLSAKYGLFPSISAVRTMATSRALRVNGRIIDDPHHVLEASTLVDNCLAIVKAGRDKFLVLMAK